MYNASETYRNLIDSGERGKFTSYIIPSETTENIEISKLTKTINLMDNLDVGRVVSAVSTIELFTDIQLQDVKFNLYTKLENEEIPHGVFTVFDSPVVSNGKVTITCYDNVKLLDRSYTSILTYPASISDILNEVSTECSVEFDLTGITFPSINIAEARTNCRDVVSHIASLLGSNVIADRSGKLKFVWFAQSGITINADNYYTFVPNEKNFELTKLSCNTGDEVITVGTNAGSVLNFTNSDMTTSQLSDLLNRLIITYRGCTCDFIGDPSIDVGDILTITDNDNISYSVPIMSLTFEYDGGCKTIIESYSKTNTSSECSTSKSGTVRIKEVESSVDRLSTTLRTEYSTKSYTQSLVEATSEELQASVEESVQNAVSTFERENYTLNITAADGNTYSENDSTLTFNATLYHNGTDITSTTASRWFRWYKTSSDSTSDKKWNTQAGRWGQSITINTSDIIKDTVLYCKCIIPIQNNLTTISGNNIVDSNGNQIVANIPSVVLTCNLPITESFSQYKSTIQMLKNKILLQIDSNGKLTTINMETGETSTITISADNIIMEGLITANGNFKILEDGSIEAVNGTFTGTVTANGGSINFDSNNDSTYTDEDYENVQILNHSELSFMKMNVATTAVESQTNITSTYITTDGDLDVYGTTTLASSPVISSDENKKNTPTKFDERYYKLAENISFKLFKYNDGTSDRFHSGVFAQEVEQYMTECDISSQEFAVFCIDEKGVYSVRYEELLVLMAWYSRERMNKLESRICFLEERMMSDV